MQKHVEAGSIEEVDLHAVPLGIGGGIGHGGAPGDFFFVIRGDGGAIFHSATRGRHLCGLQQSCNQCGLAAVRVACYSYIADILSEIVFHLANSSSYPKQS